MSITRNNDRLGFRFDALLGRGTDHEVIERPAGVGGCRSVQRAHLNSGRHISTAHSKSVGVWKEG